MATNIVRDSDVVELVNPPRFDYGQKVRSKNMCVTMALSLAKRSARFW